MTASLGTIAKIASAFDAQKQAQIGVVNRFALQAAARSLLPGERVAKCLRRVIPGKQSVNILHVPEHGKAFYANLQVCSSVWHCPVCAAKITERRRVELAGVLSSWAGGLVLVTLTLRHNVSDSLDMLLNGLLGAARRWSGGRAAGVLRGRWGVLGSVKALEVTHGVNGWHPHLHILFFTSSKRTQGFEQQARVTWVNALSSIGFDASWEHGLTAVAGNRAAADYLAKYGRASWWGLEHELTKQPVKRGRRGGRTSGQLLADYLGGDRAAGLLWQEYATAFKGRHQLQWSRGLRGRLGLGVEKSDELLNLEHEESAYLLAQLTLAQWKTVLGNDARGELLAVASTGSLEAVEAFLSDLAGVGRVHG